MDTVAMFVEVTSLQKEEILKPFLQQNKQQFPNNVPKVLKPIKKVQLTHMIHDKE